MYTRRVLFFYILLTMDSSNKNQKQTQCVHEGGLRDTLHGGIVSPVYTSTAYNYLDTGGVKYPRYFNTPNQVAVENKVAALERAPRAVLFSSGMAATMTVFLSILKAGDHIILQNDIYGGTHDALSTEMNKIGVGVSFSEPTAKEFAKHVKESTKILFIETPSNPLLKIVDIESIVSLAREHSLLCLIDNTFASPINQNPFDFGVDIVIHSGTKYLGGHSDLCCGIAVTTEALADRVRETGIHYGGSLDANTCYLLERSLKTLHLRVERQNENALKLATFLEKHPVVSKVYYPGLESHTGHEIARKQMIGFGGMLSFEVKGDPDKIVRKLKLIKPAISLGGVESTITSPARTSHARVPAEERLRLGIKDSLLRFSVGVENADDLIRDISGALA